MEIALTRAKGRPSHWLPTWLLAALFLIFTYSLFAYRAHLRYGDEYLLFSPQRFVGTLVGAGLFWLVMSNLVRVSGTRPAKPLAVIATILPASIVVLAARLVLGELVEGQVTEFQTNMRWVLVWSGYFGLWVSAALALQTAKPARPCQPAMAAPAAAAPAAERPPVELSESSVDWLIDELAAAVTSMPAAKGAALLDCLERRAGYEIADAPDPLSVHHNERVRLVRDLAARARRRL